MDLEEQLRKVEGKRFRVVHQCQCTANERSNGWGCCCARPARVVEHSDGLLKLVAAD